MNFSLCRPVKILLLGAGGTGGYVAPHLYRLMHTLNRTVRINIVDGDLVEAKNLVRQNFCAADLGENKAKVLRHATPRRLGWRLSTTPHSSKKMKICIGWSNPATFGWMENGCRN